MAHLDTHNSATNLDLARRHAQQGGHVYHAKIMLVAAGLTAFGIVAVAAAVMTTLL